MWLIIEEDGPIENTQAVLYFLAGLGFVLTFIKKSKNLWYLALALLFLMLAGEEISWGQRIFKVVTPAWFAHNNMQTETNLHNIGGIHQHVRMMAALFIVTYFIVTPVLNRYSIQFRTLFSKLRLPIYPLWGLLTFIFALMMMVIARRVEHKSDFAVDEVGELYIALGTYFFCLSELWIADTLANKPVVANIRDIKYFYIFSAICVAIGVAVGVRNILSNLIAYLA